jgi:hypothetical protein
VVKGFDPAGSNVVESNIHQLGLHTGVMVSSIPVAGDGFAATSYS